MPGEFTDALAWTTILLFLSATVAPAHRSKMRQWTAASGWTIFGLYWLVLTPHFAFAQKSIIEGAGSLIAVPAALYVAIRILNGRNSLFQLTRAVGVMGVVYLPFITVPGLAEFLIETVTQQSYQLVQFLGGNPQLIHGDNGYLNKFLLVAPSGQKLSLHVILACTGIGSMSIMTGFIGATTAPIKERARTIAIVIPIIWLLNLGRVAFITLAHGQQWFDYPVLVDPVLFLFGSSEHYMVSYFIADRLLAQSLSVVAIIGLIWMVFQTLPESKRFVENTIRALTNRDVTL